MIGQFSLVFHPASYHTIILHLGCRGCPKLWRLIGQYKDINYSNNGESNGTTNGKLNCNLDNLGVGI